MTPRPEPPPEPARHSEPPPETADVADDGDGPPPRERSRDWRPPEDIGQARAPEKGRDWRPADRAETPPRRRASAWRPPEPPAEIFDEAARRDYAARRDALARLVADPAARPELLQAALAALLASPLLEEMARHAEAERWLARLVAVNAPRGDPLIAPLIAHFRWDEQRVGPRSELGAAVLARREDLRFLESSRAVASPHQGALQALTRKAAGWRLAANRLTPGLGGRVGGFLAVVRGQRPGLLASLDADAVAWWDRHLARPRLGPIAIWTLALLPALLTLLAWSGQARRSVSDAASPLAIGAGALAAVAGVVLVNLYAIQWPRALWRDRWARAAPAWVGLGWSPALALGVLLAAVIPPSVAAGVTLFGAAMLAMFWAIAVGEPDRRQSGQPVPPFRWRGPIISFPIAFGVYVAYWGLLRPGVRFAWRARTLLGFAYLAAFWLVVSDDLAPAALLQMTGPLIAAAIGFSLGAGTLAAAWAALSWRAQRGWLIGLAGLLAAALAALWLARGLTAARPVAAALIAAAVLAHKAPASGLGPEGYTARDLVMRYGWLGLFWVTLNLADLNADRVSALVIFAIAALVALIVAVERTGHASGGGFSQRLGRIGAAALRYGWIGLAPVMLVLGAGPGVTALFGAGLWLLCGVGVTLAAYVPAGKRRAPNNP